MKFFLGSVILVGVAGCGKLNGDDAGADNAADGADASTTDTQEWERGVCDPNRPTLNQNENCDATLNAICQQWAQSVAVGAYGYSECLINPVTSMRYCYDPGCMPQCVTGQVCASNTPNGTRQCIQACFGL